MSKKLIIFLFILAPLLSWTQKHEKKVLEATAIQDAPKIDGVLDDAIWVGLPIATDFIQLSPNPLAPASNKTEVKVAYTNDAIYLAVKMYDEDPSTIMRQLTARDGFGNSDWFGVWFSCYQDGINGFEFFVTPEGVQMDAQVSTFGEDFNWNAVWQSDAKIDADGWSCEMKIPYSAIRFPDGEEQTWDVNFFRDVRKTREKTFWNTVDPEIQGSMNQSGSLTNIKNVEAPPRLFLFPYLSAYQGRLKQTDQPSTTEYNLNGGLDLKLGLSDAFTLDMTLIPDFGQVVTDNQVLNLSAFEVQFAENRQFFTEGTELFNKGNLFYSRRIGGRPINYYQKTEGDAEVKQSRETQLINAGKISGRLKNGLGVGLFNAVTRRQFAEVTDTLGNVRMVETSPLTNYNILVLDQNLKNNSYISLINTNVMRTGSTYDANVIGTVFSLKDKANAYELEGAVKYNQKFRKLGTDEEGVTEEASEEDSGYNYYLGFWKNSGNLNFGVEHGVESKHYDPNDLGFLFNANEVFYGTRVNYNIYEPFLKGRFNRMWSEAWFGYSMLHTPNVYTGKRTGAEVGFNTKGFHAFGASTNYELGYQYDYFEPRVEGMYFRQNSILNYNFWVSTDYRKKLALDASFWQNRYMGTDWETFNYRISPRIQIGDQWMITYVYSRQNEYNQRGYRFRYNDYDEITETTSTKPIFSIRDRITHTNVLSVNYVLNNRMSIDCAVRHYWSTVKQHSLHNLNSVGDLEAIDPLDYSALFEEAGFGEDTELSDLDINYNAFTVNLAYRWVFAPGSELSVVWKNAIDSDELVHTNEFSSNFQDVFGLDQVNSVSIKVLYFIDYFSLVRK